MKKFSKSLLLILLAALTLFTGCANNSGEKDHDSGTTGDDPGTEQITDTGKADETVLYDKNTSYTIIRAENCNDTVLNAAIKVYKAISGLVGSSSTSIKDDWLKPGQTPDPNAKEILIANTNRPETKQVLKTISASEFAIQRTGSKIVIAAYTGEKLNEAVDYFINQLIYADNGSGATIIKMKNDYTSKSDTADFFGDQNTLAEYSVIYKSKDMTMHAHAQKIVTALKKSYGIELPLLPDSTEPKEKEILVGTVDRPEATALENLANAEFKIFADGKKIVVGGNMGLGTSLAVDYFTNTFLSKSYSDTVNMPSDFSYVSDGKFTLAKAEPSELAEGADLRIMSFNILAELWDKNAVLEPRILPNNSVLMYFQPDVVGLQEVTDAWHHVLEEQLAGVYKFASKTIPSGETNYSTIMYNTSKAELIECQSVVYSQGNDPKLRNLTWARFRRISDGKEYIVTCTHWDIHNELREIQWKENAEIIKNLYEKYKCPIFSTGDYNSNELALYKNFMEETKMRDPKYESKVINRAGKTHHSLGSGVSNDPYSIDHIPVMGDVDLLYYNTVVCPTALRASDHCPIYIDVKLK